MRSKSKKPRERMKNTMKASYLNSSSILHALILKKPSREKNCKVLTLDSRDEMYLALVETNNPVTYIIGLELEATRKVGTSVRSQITKIQTKGNDAQTNSGPQIQRTP